MKELKQTNRSRFRKNYIKPLLDAELLVMMIPDKPKSPGQKYLITEKGKHLVAG